MQGTCQCNIATPRGSCRHAKFSGFAGLAAKLAVDRNVAAISAFAAKMEPLAVKRQGPFLLFARPQRLALDHKRMAIQPLPPHRNDTGGGWLGLAIDAVKSDRAIRRE